MTNVHIQSITREEIPELFALIKELADYEKSLDKVTANEELLTEALFGAKPCAEAILCRLNNIPIGFAVFFHNFSTYLGRKGLYLEDIFVKPEFRRSGIGKKMLAFLANVAQERNCKRMEWSVLDWNEEAMQFYKNLGAVRIDEKKVFRLTQEKIKELAS